MRTYGILIAAANRHGSETITATIVVREGESESPLNPSTNGERWETESSKHMHGLALNGLGLRGFIAEFGTDCDFLLSEVDYRDVFSIEAEQASRMVKTLARIHKQIAKEEAREHGDVLMAFAHALKLDFACWQVGPSSGWSYADNRWYFGTLAEGRERFRSEIAAARAKTAERRGITLAA